MTHTDEPKPLFSIDVYFKEDVEINDLLVAILIVLSVKEE